MDVTSGDYRSYLFILLTAILKYAYHPFYCRNSRLTVVATLCDCCIQPELRSAGKTGEKQFPDVGLYLFEAESGKIRFSMRETRENMYRNLLCNGKRKEQERWIVEIRTGNSTDRILKVQGFRWIVWYPVRCWRIYLNTIPLFRTEQLLSVVTGLCRQHATFHFLTIYVSVKI